LISILIIIKNQMISIPIMIKTQFIFTILIILCLKMNFHLNLQINSILKFSIFLTFISYFEYFIQHYFIQYHFIQYHFIKYFFKYFILD